MKRTLLIALIGLTFVATSLFAQTSQTLSISGPSGWVPGTTVTLSVYDTFTGYDAIGLSYWLMVSNAIAPSLTITSVTYFTFPFGNNIGTFPFSFNSSSGADPGFMSTTTNDTPAQSGDLGATGNGPIQPPPPGVPWHITDVTFALAANAPIGTYTLRTTIASPRASLQVDSAFGEYAFPQASFVFNVVPEPSTLALIALTGMGAGVLAYRRRK